METILLYGLLFLLISFLYSSIGHAGASGYLALMALLSFPLESIKPTSLLLNIVVAFIASFRFIQSGFFDFKLFISFAITAIPASFIGGMVPIDPFWFKIMAGVFLLLSSLLLLYKIYHSPKNTPPKMSIPYQIPLAASIGLIIGFFSGLIGVGGGIFLTPILILLNWIEIKKIAGISALFILVNSIAGILGHTASLQKIDSQVGYWIVSVMVGALLGTHFGIKKFNTNIILFCLFLVLLSAGLKFLLIDIYK